MGSGLVRPSLTITSIRCSPSETWRSALNFSTARALFFKSSGTLTYRSISPPRLVSSTREPKKRGVSSLIYRWQSTLAPLPAGRGSIKAGLGAEGRVKAVPRPKRKGTRVKGVRRIRGFDCQDTCLSARRRPSNAGTSLRMMLHRVSSSMPRYP
jgi:hypothetical protein